MAQWTTRLIMNQKIAGSSPARILCGKDLDRLVWQVDQLQLMSEVLWRNALRIILDLCIPEKELAKTRSQISFI